MGQELSAEDEGAHTAQVRAAGHRELGSRAKFKVFELVKRGEPSKAIVDTRWVLTWKSMGCKRDVNARFAATEYRGPDFKAWRVIPRSSHLPATSCSAAKKWDVWSLDIQSAFRDAGGFYREVYLRAPWERDCHRSGCSRQLRPPACGSIYAPAAEP